MKSVKENLFSKTFSHISEKIKLFKRFGALKNSVFEKFD